MIEVYFLSFCFIILMGLDVITTEHALSKIGFVEMNPIAQKFVGSFWRHFIVKLFVVIFVVVFVISIYPISQGEKIVSLTSLFLGCVGAGVVQINNIDQIFDVFTGIKMDRNVYSV